MSHTNQIQSISHRHTLWLYYFNRLNTAHRHDQKTLNCFRLLSHCASSETLQGIRKGILYYTVEDTSIHFAFNLFSTELQCYVNFFSQGTIQTMKEELTKPDFSLLRLTKKLCHKGPLWQSVSIVQVHVLGEQGMAQW